MKRHLLLPLAAILSVSSLFADTRSSKEAVNRNLEIFTSVYKELQTSYVDSIDADKTMRTAIDALLNTIDPYTEYISEDERDEFMTITTGEFGGIGAYIAQLKNGDVYISQPQDGTPAKEVGLRAGDIIVTIDGDTVLGLGSAKVRERLRGKAGTMLKVTVNRPYVGADSVLTFDITRRIINVDPVPYWGVVRDSIGYIALTTYNEKSYGQVRDALEKLKADPRVKTIALDLRGNGGGLLESAVQIVGLFVPKGSEVLRTRGKGALEEKVYKTTVKPVDTEIPLVVMIDGNSASSAEITAGSLQDLDRAVIVGNRSYGKGLVQSTRVLPYRGLLKVTIAKYYIPSGRLIQAIDYSHRNPDGSVARIPDSLTHVFYTKGGREVRDGAGITPDIKVDYPDVSRLVYNVVRDQWAFNYATKFAAEHDSIAPIENFVITDEIYADFKNFIDPARFQYDKVCEVMIENLEKAAKSEGYMTDSVQTQINVLKDLLHHNLDRDLDINRDEISDYLEREIITRFYGDKGAVYQAVKNDIGMDSVQRMLGERGKYESILHPKK
ncbi:MAG: S41 family peptidase [Muribaculaceae bacterium]|nr:S41 family peptidase [Muribaculaceae bacterium]